MKLLKIIGYGDHGHLTNYLDVTDVPSNVHKDDIPVIVPPKLPTNRKVRMEIEPDPDWDTRIPHGDSSGFK
ncbi:MAG TPA: hypothetical protein ENI23_16870 [bacterium]|nr:hypothetical protein [bacterium]